MRNLKRNLPPLTSLLAFEAAARLGSFKVAAEELNVSREAVSRQVRNLEEYLGVELFAREANAATLGPIGSRFLSTVSSNLHAIAQAAAELSGQAGTDAQEPSAIPAFEEPAARVLIVDDSPENLSQISALLEPEFEVRTAKNAPEGLEFLAAQECDLVLLDIRMPGMDGLEMCRRIRETGALMHLPVIFLTSLDDPNEETRGLETGGNDFISRPIVPAVLRARIQTQIELARTRRSLERLLSRRADRLERMEAGLAELSHTIERLKGPDTKDTTRPE